jgi:hypothetical protein
MAFQTKTRALSVAQKKLWGRLNEFITDNGGWIVSEPAVLTIRFEYPLNDSNLPDLLREAGHNVRHLGTHERLIPSTVCEQRGTKTFNSQSVVPGVVNVFQFDLPTERHD